MSIKKGYNNESEWDKIQTDNLKTYHMSENTNVIDLDDVLEFTNTIEENFLEETQTEEIQNEDFSEVLQLTQYNDGMLVESKTDFVVAEYTDIDVVILEKTHQLAAKKFVSRITKFVLEFNDVVLTEDHKNYIKQVSQLQLQHLSDLLYLTDVNKRMLNNIIARVNATQSEDYAIINSYNNLANQHLKLIKEQQNLYKSIPSVLKKMKADILCNQELEGNSENDEVITSEYGETQYNNSKQLLHSILEKRKASQETAKPN
jgi:hypothetical protein